MASAFNGSYHKRLFVMLLAFSWVLVACFVAFQYHREKQYRIVSLDSRLQMYNRQIIDALAAADTAGATSLPPAAAPLPDIRVSVIGKDGRLIFDNTLDRLPAENHLDRHEIAEAVRTGHGYTIRRHSASTDKTYFYSATGGDDVIVRSAVPYSVTLQELLGAGNMFLWFLIAATVAISVAGYYMYRLNSRLEHEQQEKIRIKKQLTNNINHELKTPVASIKVCLETIRSHPDLPKERLWTFVEQSYQHTQRLVNLLNDVSSITRMDDGAANIDMTGLDLKEIIDEATAAVNTGMEIVAAIPGRLPITGNRTYLGSIFSNLIDNATAYSGGSRITISLDGESDRSYTFSVADDGCGIPDEHLERIFERFYRIDKGRSRLAGGTGLGLSIVRNAVRLHGGSIRAANVMSADGSRTGLKFVFTLSKDAQGANRR